jgi:hypothetical protein
VSIAVCRLPHCAGYGAGGLERLHALMGDRMLDFPPHFIEKLEQRLEAMEAERFRSCDVVVPLRPATGTVQRASHAADPAQDESTAVPVSTLRALSNILDILHTAHLLQQDHITASMVSERSVECLIVCGRELLKGHAGAMWTNA